MSEEDQFAALAADELFKNLHVTRSFKKFLEDQNVAELPTFLRDVHTEGVESLVCVQCLPMFWCKCVLDGVLISSWPFCRSVDREELSAGTGGRGEPDRLSTGDVVSRRLSSAGSAAGNPAHSRR